MALVSVALAAVAALSAATKPSFSGTYILDSKQSTGSVPSYSSMAVGQNEHWFRMAQLDSDGRTERTVEGECKIDGRFHPVQGGEGGSIKCKWDGNTLLTEKHWNNDREQRTIRTTSTPDGKLMQDVHSNGSAGSNDSHLVWTKR